MSFSCEFSISSGREVVIVVGVSESLVFPLLGCDFFSFSPSLFFVLSTSNYIRITCQNSRYGRGMIVKIVCFGSDCFRPFAGISGVIGSVAFDTAALTAGGDGTRS